MADKTNKTLPAKQPIPEVVIADGKDGSMMLGLCQVMVGADLMVRLEVLDSVLRMGPLVALRVADAIRRHAIPLLNVAGSSPSTAIH